jgi:hypothetical protein
MRHVDQGPNFWWRHVSNLKKMLKDYYLFRNSLNRPALNSIMDFILLQFAHLQIHHHLGPLQTILLLPLLLHLEYS